MAITTLPSCWSLPARSRRLLTALHIWQLRPADGVISLPALTLAIAPQWRITTRRVSGDPTEREATPPGQDDSAFAAMLRASPGGQVRSLGTSHRPWRGPPAGSASRGTSCGHSALPDKS